MRVLGMDTSGYANAIGVIDGNQVLADFIFEARGDSLEKIVANIDFALKESGLTLKDIDGLGVGLGPGSWTGIRVGVTVGKILAYSTGKPISGVPTLEALACDAGDTPEPICPVISTGARDAVYAALYRRKGGGITRESEYYTGSLSGLLELTSEPAVFVTSESGLCRRLSDRAAAASNGIEVREGVARGSAIARLALNRLAGGDKDDALSLSPLYLKESTARAFVSRYASKQKGLE